MLAKNNKITSGSVKATVSFG